MMPSFFPAAGARAVYWLALVATLAGLAHIATVLLIPPVALPVLTTSRFGSLVLNQTAIMPTTDSSEDRDAAAADAMRLAMPRFADPATAMALCRFSLAQHPLRVQMPLGDELVSLSFHALDGRVFYALNDRAAQAGLIELVLMTRQQLDEAINADDDGDVTADVRLFAPVTEGVVIARVFAPQPGDLPAARQRATQLACVSDPDAIGGADKPR